jgi:hypothetical protein
MFKKASKSEYINLNGISWPLVSYSNNIFSYEDSENTEENHDDPQPAEQRYSECITLPISFTAQV